MPYAEVVPGVVISFADGEVLHAEVPEISFDLPILEAEIRSVDLNNERALLPLTAIIQIVVGKSAPAPDASVLRGWDRAAFHFLDGQVLRAWIAPDALLGRHGGVWSVVEPGGEEMRTVAIPYCALKGVFRIRQWDSRPFSERAADGDRAHLVTRILAERERNLADLETPEKRRPLMTRVGRRRPG